MLQFVEVGLVSRACAAAVSLALDLDLHVDEVTIVQNSNRLAIRLLPCDVLARAAVVGQEVAAFEVSIAQDLAGLAAPIAMLDPRVPPRVFECDGFAVTFWSYWSPSADLVTPADYAAALHHLHEAMRVSKAEAPHFTDRIADAEILLINRHNTPELADADRTLLVDTLREAARSIISRPHAEQLLHGEPHPGNLLTTRNGPLFIDLETCCYGPIEFDLAHVPQDVSRLYPGADHSLIQKSRQLILAMVGAWRCYVRDEFPDGRRHGQNILRLLRAGPPWPALGALAAEKP